MQELDLVVSQQSCTTCQHSWSGYAHGFMRGHTLFQKNGKVLVAWDDLGYLVPQGEYVDIEHQLIQYGWYQLESCPRCGARNSLVDSFANVAKVQCFEIERQHMEKQGKHWHISEIALAEFDSRE